LFCYEDHVNRNVHLALVHGDLDGGELPLVRVHVQDTLGDVIGVQSPRLGWPLRAAMRRIADAGTGVVVLLRYPETPRQLVGAVRSLAHATPAESARRERVAVLRTFGTGAQILRDLGVTRMRVLSAPKQMHAISGFGLEVVEYVDDPA
jgi:3,4-dihydroxy 2-butanone 4-phosphate synthase/GTP cyclohydrolase II